MTPILACFIKLCEKIGFPISLDKTSWSCSWITFLGFLLDSERQLVYIPKEKINRAEELINIMLAKKKTTLKEVQKLCGLLNFFGRCVIPGRAFTRRLYALTKGLTKPHHHVALKQENKSDFKNLAEVFNTPFSICSSLCRFLQVVHSRRYPYVL